MSDAISNLSGPELIGFVGMIGGLIATTAVVIASIAIPLLTWARRVEAVTQLKRDLVASGFSADDIERVVRAAPGESSPAPSAGSRKLPGGA